MCFRLSSDGKMNLILECLFHCDHLDSSKIKVHKQANKQTNLFFFSRQWTELESHLCSTPVPAHVLHCDAMVIIIAPP